jgi:tetratricopeptide (TPR) repeat protein
MGLALAGLLMLGAAGCSRSDAAPAPSAERVVLRPPSTTAASIAVHNLNASIADRERKSRAGDLEAEKELVGYYAMRARFLGRVADLAAADETSAHLVAARPADPAAHLERARALSGIHELRAALDEVDRAARLGAPEAQVASGRASLLLALGREDEAARLAGRPGMGADVGAYVMAAGIASRRGRTEASDALFEAARTGYRDVSPFTVAWVDFERARALEARADRASARAYLSEAVTVLPCYAHAAVHLAALEAAQDALRHLAALDGTSDDPDVLAAEADALRRAGRGPEAEAKASQARARFEEVVAALPRAYADHAASFYLGAGRDPSRALVLAKANAANRPTSEAVELWLTAAIEAGSHDEQCAAAKAPVEHPTASLEELRATARGCR